MNETISAIQVSVVRDSRNPARPPGTASIPTSAIVSFEDATPSGPHPAGRVRCRIHLHDTPAESVPWVFRSDADEVPAPPELLVAETVLQVKGLMKMAVRESRSVSTKDLGEAAAQGAREGLRVPITLSAPLRPVWKKKPPSN